MEVANRKDDREVDKRAYWVWLQHAFRAGSAKPWRIFNHFQGGIEEFWRGGSPLWNSMQFITEREARALTIISINQAEMMLEMYQKLGHSVMTPECEKYPETLRNIFAPPAVLYYQGEMQDVDVNPTVAIVGTRKASQRSMDAAMTFGYQFALSGAVVVSGCAKGVDIAAHRGVLRGLGKSICVLPCGLLNNYPMENYSMRQRIAEEGIIITEYPGDTQVERGAFQLRNRILSGLSCGILVIEAPKGSGALITAKYAKEQDRDVFVYPVEDGDLTSVGGQELIDDGAKPVTSASEILSEYQFRFSSGARTSTYRAQERADSAVLQTEFSVNSIKSRNAGTAIQKVKPGEVKSTHSNQKLQSSDIFSPETGRTKAVKHKEENIVNTTELDGIASGIVNTKKVFEADSAVKKTTQIKKPCDKSQPVYLPKENDKTVQTKPEKLHNSDGLSEVAKLIFLTMSSEPKHISEIEEATGLPTSKLLGGLTELEISGKIKSYSGRRYSLF